MRSGRGVAAVVLVAPGAVLAWYGWRIVATIWGEGDSPAWAYLMFGLPLIIVWIGCVAAAWLLVQRRH